MRHHFLIAAWSKSGAAGWRTKEPCQVFAVAKSRFLLQANAFTLRLGSASQAEIVDFCGPENGAALWHHFPAQAKILSESGDHPGPEFGATMRHHFLARESEHLTAIPVTR